MNPSESSAASAVEASAGAQASAREGLGRSAAKGVGITLVVQLGRTTLLFVSIVALARLLAPADFGYVAMVMSVIGIADLIRDFGLSLATMRAPTLSRGERTNLFWANLGLGGLCTLAALAAAPLIVAGYGESRLSEVVVPLSFVFLLSGFSTQFRAGLARDMRYKALGLVDLSAQAMGVATAITLAVLGAGVWALIAQQLIAALSNAVLFVAMARWWPGWWVRGVSIRGFMKFGGGVFGTQAISYATKNADNIAVGAVFGATTLGFYSRAWQLMMMPLNQINAPMTSVALPVLGRVQDDDVVFLSYLRKAQLVGCYLTASLFAVALGLSEPIIDVLFGPRWTAVVPIFAILAIGGMFRAVSQIAYWAYLARGKSGALLRQRMVTGPLTVALLLAGLPWGPSGVAAGQTVAAVMAWQVALWHAGKVTQLNTRPLMTNAARILLQIGAPCGAAAHLATYVPVISVAQVLLGLAFALSYVGVAWLLFAQVRADLHLIVSFGRQAVSRKLAR